MCMIRSNNQKKMRRYSGEFGWWLSIQHCLIISIDSSIILNIFLLGLHWLDSNLFLFPFHMTFGINRVQPTNFGCMKEENLLFIPPRASLYCIFFPADVFFQMMASQNYPLVTSRSAPGESLLKGLSFPLRPFLSVGAMVPQNANHTWGRE